MRHSGSAAEVWPIANKYLSIIKGSLCAIAAVGFSICASVPILLLGLGKFLVPNAAFKQACTNKANIVGTGWVLMNRWFYFLLHRPQWQVSGLEELSRDEWYLIFSNHQSWTDIAVLMFLINGRTSPLKFFIKQELIWLPFVGIACWILDFPFMKRYPKEVLENNPGLRVKDQETTRKFCEKFRHTPASIINFIEGTRFTEAKHKMQDSPYRFLLKPKSGGLAYVVGNMGERFHQLLDITIIYQGGRKDFFGFLCGQIDPIVIDVKSRTIPEHILEGDYQESDEFRAVFQAWIGQLWQEKDALIAEYIDAK